MPVKSVSTVMIHNLQASLQYNAVVGGKTFSHTLYSAGEEGFKIIYDMKHCFQPVSD